MNFRYIILFSVFLLFSCEKVIDLELDTAEPKLVIEASFNVSEIGEQSQARVQLSLTIPYFDTQNTFVNDAEVNVIDETGNITNLDLYQNGIYNEPLIIDPEKEYTLQIIYKNEIYTATSQMVSTVPIEFIEQKDDGGFNGEEIELKAFFTDPGGEKNFYFYEALSAKGNIYDAINDDFFDGNQIFGFYTVEDLEPGDVVSFNLYGIDSQAYDYLFNLLLQTEAPAGPFETQPATVRGNFVNTTNPDNFPLGYFRISEVSRLSYTVE